MTEDEHTRAIALRDMVTAVMNGASDAPRTKMGGEAVDGTLMLRAFEFIIAASLEAHPELQTNKALREEAERIGKRIHDYMRRFRQDFAQRGVHVWDELNAPAPRMQ